LNRFVDNYTAIADSGLIEGAKFELQHMGKNIDEIPILSDLGNSEDQESDKKETDESKHE